jgi:adenosylcobinamide-phosphate synthase
MFLDLSIAWIMLGALLIEGAVGYPKTVWKKIGHPVSWMGQLISSCEHMMNSAGRNVMRDFVYGALTLLLLILLVGGISFAILWGLRQVSFGWVVQLVLCATLLAGRNLYNHVLAVAKVLQEDGLLAGREAVSMIVGRDPQYLDEAGVSRAAIETLAENTSDGVVAPLFWGVLAGLPGMAIYKAVNTADSMIGHRNERYEWFGKAAAKLDDLLNLVPARITGMLFVCAALHRRTIHRAFSVMWGDASRHLSPNAGWPEAAMAGALNCRLGGPRHYEGGDSAVGVWLGDGAVDIGHDDIRRALILYKRVLLIVVSALFFFACFQWSLG